MEKKGLICLVLAILMLFFASACADDDSTDQDQSSSSSNNEQPIADPEYTVRFLDGENSIAEVKITDISQLTYPSLSVRITVNEIDYDFMGWDATGDGVADEISTVESDLTLRSVYERASEFVLSYTVGGEQKTLTVTNATAFTLTPPTSTAEKVFLYYQDEKGYPYTDEGGNKLPNVDIERSLTLTAKFLDSQAQLQQIYYLNYPSKRIEGEELSRLIAAIDSDEAVFDKNDPDHILFDGREYQSVVCVKRGNIFRDFTRAEQGKRYYFRYTPLKWDISEVAVTQTAEGFEILFDGTTAEILRAFTPQVTNYATTPSSPPAIHISPVAIPLLEPKITERGSFLVGGMQTPTLVSDGANMVEARKLANDYLIASSSVEISYEKGSMFAVAYALDIPVNEYASSAYVYIYNHTGERVVVSQNGLYGLVNRYKIKAEVGKAQ